jgi:hypothetical protein
MCPYREILGAVKQAEQMALEYDGHFLEWQLVGTLGKLFSHFREQDSGYA